MSLTWQLPEMFEVSFQDSSLVLDVESAIDILVNWTFHGPLVPGTLNDVFIVPVWIYFEGSTSSMRAMVLLQTVCNALVRGQRLFLTMSQICQLEGGFW